ncbi:DJ-1/PfpI family protein [Cupriavidus sp. CV2]|uniref:DJ-1/PfpI family protein n=1 Tax=Cupriavidus ulmosensis TaxID=3065913 RepID=UPI00296ACE50|nr:DJ-1/PfpI family protein [Cupriavidus sp. CV2]MDW3688796.1 DJ-1/PfpI family protein [Cupriavidus sp. CV2]
MHYAIMTRLAALALCICSLYGCLEPAVHPPASSAPAGTSHAAAASPPGMPATIALPAPKAGRARPVVAVLADNAGTEVTDFVIPFAVLKEADVADVHAVSTDAGTVTLMPALHVRADLSVAGFDAAFPAGADIVIVPAMHSDDTPATLAWLRAQAQRGALVVAVCEGARVVANAGLLDGRSATTHWYAMRSVAAKFPATRWVRDRRYLADGNVVTSSGVTASLPLSLALVEAISGRQVAVATASRLGVTQWSPLHDSAPFKLGAASIGIALSNRLAWWRHEAIGIAVAPGFDEIALALQADAWSRTYRSEALALGTAATLRSRRGLWLEADAIATSTAGRHDLPAYAGKPAAALDAALAGIQDRYGRATAQFVALQLEYPRPREPATRRDRDPDSK